MEHELVAKETEALPYRYLIRKRYLSLSRMAARSALSDIFPRLPDGLEP